MSTRSKILGEAIITEKLGKPVALLLVFREGNCSEFGKGFIITLGKGVLWNMELNSIYKTVGKVQKAPQRRVG